MSHDASALESDLKYWGYHHGKQIVAALDGFCPESIFGVIFDRMPLSGVPGHKILIRDMPWRAWLIHHEVFSLPEVLRDSLIARYCVPPRAEDGRMFTKTEISQTLGCHRTTFQRRVRQAKRRLLGAREELTGASFVT